MVKKKQLCVWKGGSGFVYLPSQEKQNETIND